MVLSVKGRFSEIKSPGFKLQKKQTEFHKVQIKFLKDKNMC